MLMETSLSTVRERKDLTLYSKKKVSDVIVVKNEKYYIEIRWRDLGKMFGFSDDLIKRISKKCSNLARVLEEIIVKVMFQGHGTVQMTDSIGDARFTVHLDQKYLDAREHASISSYMGWYGDRAHTSSQTDLVTYFLKKPKLQHSLSGFSEPKIDPNFPYLPVLSDDSLHLLKVKLAEDRSKICCCFASLVFELQKCVEATKSSPESVADVIAARDLNFKNFLKDCPTVSKLFKASGDYWSFFDHEVVRLIVNAFGSEQVHANWEKFMELFDEYTRRLVCECPFDVFGSESKSKDKIIRMKFENSVRRLRLYQLNNLCKNLNQIIQNHIHLIKVERGCVRLTFKVLPDALEGGLNLTEDQKEALRELGILSLSYGDEKYDLSPASGAATGESSSTAKEGAGPESTDKEEGAVNTDTPEASESSTVDDENEAIEEVVEDSAMESQTETYPDLDQVIKDGNLQQFKDLIENGGLNPHTENQANDTALHIAAARGVLDVLKYLIEDVGLSAVLPSSHGTTPLRRAIESNQLHIVQYLVGEREVNPLNREKDGSSPLHAACGSGNLEMVQYLMKQAQLRTALNEIFTLFTEYEITPLDVACRNGHVVIVEYFLSDLQCDPNMQSNLSPRPPIFQACLMGHINVLKCLTGHPNCNSFVKDVGTGGTILHVAATQGYLHIVQYLTRELNFDPYARDASTNTPLHDAARIGHFDIVQFFITELKCDPNYPSSDGRTPLHMACLAGHLRVVKFIVEQCSCDPSSRDGDMVTPLHLAAKGGHLSIVQYLTLDRNCDIMSQTSDMSTPLHWAAYEGQLEVVKFFVEVLRCPMNIKGRRNQTPLELALEKGHDDVTDYLRSASI